MTRVGFIGSIIDMLKRSLSKLPEFIAGDRSILREFLNPEKETFEKVNYSIAHATVPPETITHKHKLTSSEIYYIISGKGTMHIDTESSDVEPDDLVYIPPGSMQWIVNSSGENLKFLCFVEPAWTEACETVFH